MEDENNGTQESEISDNEYLSDFTKLETYKYEPFFTTFKSVRKKNAQEKNYQIQKKTLVRLEILSAFVW